MRRTLIGGIAVCALLAPAAPAFCRGRTHPRLRHGAPGRQTRPETVGRHPQTGYFGPVTLEAVKTYQRAHGIPTTGGPPDVGIADRTAEVEARRQEVKQKQKDKKAAKKKAANKKAARRSRRRPRRTSAAATLKFGDRGAAVLFLQKELNVQPRPDISARSPNRS